ncbi:MAG: carboxymuconolactone decarboxylase family protein [Steroidobacteraceae bacterium]
MVPRLNPYLASPQAMQELISFQDCTYMTGLDVSLMELLRTRVSQINGCAHGISLHTRNARARGETEERLYMLDAWRNAPVYSRRERAALAWTEAVTLVSHSQVPDGVFEEMRQCFTEEQLVNLTLAIAATNAWNRVEISFRQIPSVGV